MYMMTLPGVFCHQGLWSVSILLCQKHWTFVSWAHNCMGAGFAVSACAKVSWKLSDISQVELVSGSVTVRIGTRHGTYSTVTHQFNPGLGILLRNGTRILMQMPNTVNFCTQLRQQCNLPTITTSELLWQAIMNTTCI